MLAGVCELAARSLIALFLVPIFGYLAVCFTDAAAWILAGGCVLVMYLHIWKKNHKRMGRARKNSQIINNVTWKKQREVFDFNKKVFKSTWRMLRFSMYFFCGRR